jgi:hypothetical protein
MIEVILHGRASCPHCRKLYELIKRELARHRLDRVVIFRVVDEFRHGPVPDVTRIVDLRAQAETGSMYTGFLSDFVPVIEIKLYLSDGTVISQVITQSTIPAEIVRKVGDIYEAIAKTVAETILLYRRLLM